MIKDLRAFKHPCAVNLAQHHYTTATILLAKYVVNVNRHSPFGL
jgi:hypothetical protein